MSPSRLGKNEHRGGLPILTLEYSPGTFSSDPGLEIKESKIAMVQVHHFKVWNINKGDWEIPPSKRTAESIAELKGHIIPDTAEEVSSLQLDDQGRYFPTGAAVQVDRPIDEGRVKRKPK